MQANKIPLEIQKIIFDFLPFWAQIRLRRVCQTWNQWTIDKYPFCHQNLRDLRKNHEFGWFFQSIWWRNRGLQTACARNDLSLLRILIADIDDEEELYSLNLRWNEGLYWACKHKQSEIINFMVYKGASNCAHCLDHQFM